MAAIALLSAVASASAQVTPLAPSVGTTTFGSGAGMDGAVSPTGGFAASVPLDLPSPRGSVPIPLSVVYTGSGRAGVAGQGWHVPISYVRRSTSIWRRKPYANLQQSASEAPVAATRVTVTLGGQTHLMRDVGAAWWPTRGESFMQLTQQAGNEWSLKTLDNHEYVFRPAAAMSSASDDGLWLLAEIRDSIGGDKVVLRYDVPSVETCSAGLALRSLAYTYNASGSTPLYEIELAYEPDWRTRLSAAEERFLRPCATRSESEAAYPFDIGVEDGTSFTRAQILRSVQVKARNNLIGRLGSKVIRSYGFEYDHDPVTQRPRLHHVTTKGEEGIAGPTLPLATYGYGSLAADAPGAASLKFSDPIPIARPLPPGSTYDREMSTTDVSVVVDDTVETEKSTARHVMRDFTGDGLADLVYKTGGTWYVHTNRLTATGPSFSATPFSWSGPTEIFEQWKTRDTDDSLAARSKLVTTVTWNQFVDWNGDGRLDVIDARGGIDNAHWRVWLNRPGSSGGIAWSATQVDISPLREHLRARGFITDGERVPIDRARSWARSDVATCSYQLCDGNGCQAVTECPPDWIGSGHRWTGHTDTMSDWVLTDLNGDGYLDVAAGTVPVQYHEDGTWRWSGTAPAPVCTNENQDGNTYTRFCRFRMHQWMDAMRWVSADGDPITPASVVERSERIEFLNRHGAFQAINGSPFSAIGHRGTGDARFGIARWSTGMYSMEGPGVTLKSPYNWQAAGYVDQQGNGRATLRTFENYSEFNVMPAFFNDRETACENDEDYFMSRQVRGEVDVDGDGLSDFVSGNTVRFNLGAGYGLPRQIQVPPSMPFDVSRTAGRCAGRGYNDGGLTDLDGDGRPDLLRVADGQLWMSRLQPAGGLDPASAQRLLTVDNGFGAVTYVKYRNAKRDNLASHSVPFPEIVVGESGTEIGDGSGPNLAPTYYAYGGAEMVYDPLAVSWVFPGYRRQVALRGKREKVDDPSIGAIVTITDRDPTAPAGSAYAQQVSSGRISRVSSFEITTPAAPWLYLNWSGAPVHAQTSMSHAALQMVNGQTGAPPVVSPEALECGDIDPATGALVGTGMCRAAGLAYTRQSESWEGISAPPSLLNVLSGSSVDRVDHFGRPTLIVGKGDLRRTDDDVCTNITYANTSTDPKKPTSSAFPSVVSSVVLTDCGWGRPNGGQPGTPQILTAAHFRYDNLPQGQAVRGLLTARDVDRYGPGGFIDSHEVEAFTHNAFGEVESATSTRNTGAVSTQATWFTYDEFGATVTQVGTTASDVATTLTSTESAYSWPSFASVTTDHSGLNTVVERDAFGRVKREFVQPFGGQKTTLRRYEYSDVVPRRVTVESFPGTTPIGSEASATDRIRTHSVLDALGRVRYTQAELGADYANTTLISGFTIFDELGAPRYQADAFEAPLDFAPTATMALPFGSTLTYDRRGRVTREVTAPGINETANNTSIVGDIFVRHFTYGYEGGLAYTATRGRDENDPSSARYQAHDDEWSTAIGRQVRRARLAANGSRKDRVDQEWDRLGRVIETRRYLVPSTGIGAVTWRSTFDSLGNRLTLTEPGVSARNFEYDEQGRELWSWWMDGTTRRGVVSQYDGLGRMTTRLLTSTPAGSTTIVESQDRMTWDVPVGGADQPSSFLSGRLSAIETVGVGSAYLAYDPYGRTASTSYRYNNHNELVREQVAYTAGGRATDLTLITARAARQVSYRYDSAGRTRRVETLGQTLFNAEIVSAKGQYKSVLYGNGVRESFSYAPDGREELLGWGASTMSGDYKSANVAYDGAGRVTEETQETPTGSIRRTYTFDDLGRVTRSAQAGGAGAGTEDYTHDPLGNVLTRTATTGTPSRYYTFDPVDPDRLCRAAAPGTTGDCQFTYDGAGNIVADRHMTVFGTTIMHRFYTYDAANRILSARRSSRNVTFTYGPSGRSRTDVTGTSFDRTVWHFGGIIEEVRPAGSSAVRTTFAIPGPLGIAASLRFENATLRDTVYSHGDPRGSRFFTGSTGHVVQETVYSLFGRLFSNSAPDLTGHSYTDDLWNGGDYFPDVGISILGARAYDAELGRFLERDPIMNTSRSVTAHPYAFAFNDPANLTDASGMQPAGSPNEQPHGLEPMMPQGSVFAPGFGTGGSVGAGVDNLPGAKGVSFASMAMSWAMTQPVRPQTATGTGIDPVRAARFVVKNSPLNPHANFKVFKSFLREGDRTLRYSLPVLARCGGQPVCAGFKVTGDALIAIDSYEGSLSAPSGAGVYNWFCPGDDCTDTTGVIAFGVATGGETALGISDDLARGLTGGLDDVWDAWGSGHFKPDDISWITPGSLPAAEEAALLRTLSHIDAGTVPTGAVSRKWGATFYNNRGYLPGGNAGIFSPFREYRVAPPPGTHGAGALRVVQNTHSGELYFTWTHYGDRGAKPSFVRLR